MPHLICDAREICGAAHILRLVTIVVLQNNQLIVEQAFGVVFEKLIGLGVLPGKQQAAVGNEPTHGCRSDRQWCQQVSAMMACRQ